MVQTVMNSAWVYARQVLDRKVRRDIRRLEIMEHNLRAELNEARTLCRRARAMEALWHQVAEARGRFVNDVLGADVIPDNIMPGLEHAA